MKAKTLSKKYIRVVISEIVNVKRYATEKEKNGLIYNKFHPRFSWKCIYGLITGDCFSKETSTLINKCVDFGVYVPSSNASHVGIFNFVLIKVKRFFRFKCKRNYYTPLENFISLIGYRKYTRNIFKFIKGETKTLQIRELLT